MPPSMKPNSKVSPTTNSTKSSKWYLSLYLESQKEAEENIAKPKVEEINGFKYAPLAPTGPTSVKVDVNEPLLSVRKPAVDINSNPTSLPVTQINPPVFTNTKLNDFKPLEKSAQQQKEEEMELKMK